MSLSDPHSLRRIRLLLALSWLLLGLAVLAGSLLPDLGPSSLNIPLPHADKLVHFSAWALLAAFAPPLLVRFASRLAAASGLFLLSGAIELAQAFLPPRSASFGDLAAHGLGIAVGTAAIATQAEIVRMSTFCCMATRASAASTSALSISS